MKLQLKYYWAAILDWQGSERMLNSQQLPLASLRSDSQQNVAHSPMLGI